MSPEIPAHVLYVFKIVYRIRHSIEEDHGHNQCLVFYQSKKKEGYGRQWKGDEHHSTAAKSEFSLIYSSVQKAEPFQNRAHNSRNKKGDVVPSVDLFLVQIHLQK